MSVNLATHAEIVKIAHLFQCEPEELEYLADCQPETLVELRMQLVELFYGDENSSLKRFAKVGNLLPSSVIAGLTREAVGPVLAARIAGFVDPKQAANVVSKLPVEFVVDIAVAIDPRRVAPVVGRLDTDFIQELAFELVRREEYVVMGQFVGFAPEETLHAVFNFASDEALLRTAFVAEDKERISIALAPQTDERINGIIAAAFEHDLWPEAMDLFVQLSDEQYLRVINLAGELPSKMLDRLVAATTEDECWPILIPAVAQMDEPNHAAGALLRADDEIFLSFIDTLIGDGAWDEATELFEKLNDKNRDAFLARVTAAGLIERFIGVAPASMLQTVVELAPNRTLLNTAFAVEDKAPISKALTPQTDERIEDLVKFVVNKGPLPEALELFAAFSDKQHTRIVNIASELSPTLTTKMIKTATEEKCWPALVPAIARMKNPNNACAVLLQSDAADVKAFAKAVAAENAWDQAGAILGKLKADNRDELIKRLTKLKLADGFIDSLPSALAA